MTTTYLLLRFGKLRYGYWLILPLIAANVIMSKMMVPWFFCSGWMFTAFPFMMLGTLLHEKSLCDRFPVMLFIGAGCALAIVEGVAFRFSYLCLGNVLLAIGVLLLAIKKNEMRWARGLTDFGRWCTPVIFIVHCSVKDIVYAVIGTPRDAAVNYMPFVIFVICGSLAILVQSGIRKKF